MADRIFAGVVLAIIVGYGIIAFTVIKAPFQYDPLGPESWPQILAVVAGLCTLLILLRPDVAAVDVDGASLVRLVAVLVLLGAYGWLFEPLGFMLSTALFCAAMTRLLGGGLPQALVFGVVTGVVGYAVCTVLLELNLPLGDLIKPLLARGGTN